MTVSTVSLFICISQGKEKQPTGLSYDRVTKSGTGFVVNLYDSVCDVENLTRETQLQISETETE